MRHFFPKVVSYKRFVKLEKAKNLNLNDQKQAKRPMFFSKQRYVLKSHHQQNINR